MRYRDSDSTVANSVLQRGTNIATSKICAECLVFPGTVTYTCLICWVCLYFSADESFQRGRLSIRAFELLQYALSAPSLYQCIGARRIRFATSLRLKNDDVDMYHLSHYLKKSCTHEESGSILIQMWIDGLSPKPATWQSLVKVLASIEELASLGRIIEDLLTKPEKGNTTKIVGEEAVVTGKAGVYVSSLKEQLQEARDANKVLKMESQQRMEEKAQGRHVCVHLYLHNYVCVCV